MGGGREREWGGGGTLAYPKYLSKVDGGVMLSVAAAARALLGEKNDPSTTTFSVTSSAGIRRRPL